LLDEGFVSIVSANNRLVEAAILYVSIALASQSCYVISVYFSQNLGWGATNRLRSDLTRHCIDLDMSFHNNQTPGKMIERIDGDITTLSTFFSRFILLVIANIVLIAGILVALFLEDFSLGIIFTVFTLVTIVILFSIWNRAVSHWKTAREINTELLGYIEESLSGKEDICALDSSKYILRRFHHISKKEYDMTMKAVVVSRVIQITIEGMVALGSTLVFMVGIPLLGRGDITIGTIFLVNSYIALLFRPIIQIVRQTQEFTLASAAIERINEFFNIEKKIENNGKTEINRIEPLSVDFSNVSFSYIDDKPVLRNVSFRVSPGKILGIIGRTGSGKTTISRLFFRLYDPFDGEIRIDGINIADLTLENLRSNIAYVTQKVELFNASLRDNITFFDRSIPDERILRVIKDVGLQQWYERLPDGLNTKLLSGENGLSAGESQLLAFTRVFLKNPRIVVLDEASSRLDPATEHLIEKAIDKLLHDRTAIIIAHRLKTLDRADEILLMENGQVIETGKRTELAKDPESHFSQLLRTGMKEVLT